MKRPTVFSLVREQSVFMTAVIGLMTFLAVLALGVAMSIGNGVIKWNRQWNTFATIQVTNADKLKTVQNILKENAKKINSTHELNTDEMADLMRPWVGGGRSVLEKYMPSMIEVNFKSDSDMATIGRQIESHAKFLPHRDALTSSISTGWKIVAILSIILGLVIGTIGVCISFIARNTAILHRRELEILNQVGASDKFIINQMQTIVSRICIIASGVGFLVAAPILMVIMAVAHSARTGLMASLEIGGGTWLTLVLMPAAIIIFAIIVTRKTTAKILNQE